MPLGPAANTARAWTPEQHGPQVALVTASDLLREEVRRIALAASVQLRTASTVQELGTGPALPDTILVGSDISENHVRRGTSSILIGLAGEGDALWEQAAQLGAERVAVLPEAAGWLAEYLTTLDGHEPAHHVLGVIGGCGGAGASTLACWLAAAAGERGNRVLLVDAEPLGGGLDVALGAEQTAGIRWEDMHAARGSINPSQLHSSLPETGGFSLLSHRAGEAADPQAAASAPLPLEVSDEVFAAARRGYDLTVVDVGRGEGGLEAAELACDSLIMVVPAQVRAAAAARQLRFRFQHQGISLVVRGPLRAGADAQLVADSVGIELSAYWKSMRGLPAAAENGQLLEFAARRGVRRMTTTLLDELPGQDWQGAA